MPSPTPSPGSAAKPGPPGPFRAGCAYFAIVFAAGFVLGTVRVLAVIPLTGERTAVLIELPVMLLLSWLAAGWLIGRYRIAPRPGPRATMGGTALVLLMLAEFGLAALLFGRSPAEHLGQYHDLPARIGLAGQITFGLIPVVRLAWEKPTRV